MPPITHINDGEKANAGKGAFAGCDELVEDCIAEAQAGDMFAPFRPSVLAALAKEYLKGAAHWSAVSERFKLANNLVPLNDLDRAVRNSVATALIDELGYNYSVVMGAALAAAEAGDDRAPFEHTVIDAFVALWVRDEDHPRKVGRTFEQANAHIFWYELKAAVERRALTMLGTPRAFDITWLAKYQWDRSVGAVGASHVH